MNEGIVLIKRWYRSRFPSYLWGHTRKFM